MSIPEVPTLHPSEAEFRDPIAYLSSPEICGLGVKYGMVKLVPPASFRPPLSINKHKFRFIPRIQKLKELNLLNRCRLFFYKQLLNYNKMNGLVEPTDAFETVENGVKLHYYDLFIAIVRALKDKDSSGEKLPDISSHVLSTKPLLWADISVTLKIPVQSLQQVYHSKLIKYFNFLSEKSEFTHALVQEKYPSSLLFEDSEDSDDDEEEESCLICKKNDHPDDTLLCDSCDKPYHRYCLSPPLSKIPKNSWYCDNCMIGNGHYGFKDSTFEYSLEDFKDLCSDFDKDFFKGEDKPNISVMEKIFWDLVDNIDNDIKINYGADIHNSRRGEVSGFPTRDYYTPKTELTKSEYKKYVDHPMNLNNLPFDRCSLLNFLNVDISGMTIPWIYVGNTFSTFCWHVEDQYTLSANYQHFGATKKWYSIPASQADRFEGFMKNLAPDLFAKQPDILHQLITLVSPFKLRDNGITCFTANQQPGEYVITYPRVYHAGFNAGFNFNEAVNFTMTQWLDFGVQATNNYKKGVNKASVFDIWELMVNILKSFEEGAQVDLKLINKALHILKPKLNDEYSLRETADEIFEGEAQKYIKRTEKNINYDSSKEVKEQEEDGFACSKCKGFCTFSFVKHYEPVNSTIKSYLPTPNASPNEDEEKDSRRSKRLKIQQDVESYKIDILCLDDYLKVKPNEKDEYFSLRDLDETKELIQKVDLMIKRRH